MKLIQLDKTTWVGCGDLMAQPSHGQNLCGVVPAWRMATLLECFRQWSTCPKPKGSDYPTRVTRPRQTPEHHAADRATGLERQLIDVLRWLKQHPLLWASLRPNQQSNIFCNIQYPISAEFSYALQRLYIIRHVLLTSV